MESYAISLILSKILFVTVLVCQPVKHPWEPETRDQLLITPDPSSHLWRTKNEKANYTGLIHAPRLAFNWIVYVQVEESTGLNGAIGNLISEKVVFTNCRVGLFVNKGHTSFIIYATQYLYEKHSIEKKLGSYDVEGIQGKQEVVRVTLDPHCAPKLIAWDVSIFEVNWPIFPLVPLMGFMPIAVDYESSKIRSSEFPDQSVPNFERTTCWVGTFGRQSYNNPEPLDTDDLKVQYRVYSLPLTSCSQNVKFLCADDEPCKSYEPVDINNLNLKCFETRAKVGGVCDQDRGAPIACDGEVIAIVLRGAQWKFCNNLIHLPFFAQGLDSFENYFAEAIRDRVYSPKLPLSYSKPVYSSVSLYFIIASLVVLFKIYFNFS